MKIIKTVMTAAGLVALAACNGADSDNNMAADANIMMTDNFETPVDNVDMNLDMNAVDNNVVDNTTNTADNTTNSY